LYDIVKSTSPHDFKQNETNFGCIGQVTDGTAKVWDIPGARKDQCGSSMD
jgi:hypothetical protein